VTDVKTDALIVQVSQKRRKLMEAIADTTFAGLADLRGGRKINSYCGMAGVADAERVFKYSEETKRLVDARWREYFPIGK
jgi:hypothetical protein